MVRMYLKGMALVNEELKGYSHEMLCIYKVSYISREGNEMKVGKIIAGLVNEQLYHLRWKPCQKNPGSSIQPPR